MLRKKTVKKAIRKLPVTNRLDKIKRTHYRISNHTPNKIHYVVEPVEVKQTWKNYHPKNKLPVNSYPD
ncbi:MAG: hypothetical protein LC117_10385 [Bacteroidia bacterium]|nr:hypothetical protein [Bacteroidia bacterium]MCZ2278323.1 hypothetical protein [Bacteroidia bacterium]